MNTSQHEVIATLSSCLPIYKKLYEIPGYKLSLKEIGCLERFYGIWETGILDDETIIKEAGISFEIFGGLIGYASIALNISKSG